MAVLETDPIPAYRVTETSLTHPVLCPLFSRCYSTGSCLGTNTLLLSHILPNFLSVHLNSSCFVTPRLLNLKFKKSALPVAPPLKLCIQTVYGQKDEGESDVLILAFLPGPVPWLLSHSPPDSSKKNIICQKRSINDFPFNIIIY